ncbi:MAG: hypothetical protein II885_07205 [Oscillospiraceae bacterium]|nr:hypothetical protein [Oscillospiraceae bacterium]
MTTLKNKIYFKIFEPSDLDSFDRLAELLHNDNPVYALGVTGELVGILKLLSNKLEYWQRVGSFYNENKEHMTLHFVPVRYATDGSPADYVKARVAAIYELFYRWTNAGLNKKHAKDPFGCKSFNAFLSENYSRTEYIIFLSPDDPKYDGLYRRRPKQ